MTEEKIQQLEIKNKELEWLVVHLDKPEWREILEKKVLEYRQENQRLQRMNLIHKKTIEEKNSLIDEISNQGPTVGLIYKKKNIEIEELQAQIAQVQLNLGNMIEKNLKLVEQNDQYMKINEQMKNCQNCYHDKKYIEIWRKYCFEICKYNITPGKEDNWQRKEKKNIE